MLSLTIYHPADLVISKNIKDLSEKSKDCPLLENCCKRLKKDLLTIRGSQLVNSCVYLK